MNSRNFLIYIMTPFVGICVLFTVVSNTAFAHCDTLGGPVVKTAKIALDKADVTPVLKWVRADEEEEVRATFQEALSVRSMGAEAKELADMYFFETLVRIHRAGEGAPYTGLKPGEAIDPAVALADKALETGSVDKLADVLTTALVNGLKQRFKHASETKEHANETVVAGREFVEAYVTFTHYVEGLHMLIKGNANHHDGDTKGHGGHDQ